MTRSPAAGIILLCLLSPGPAAAQSIPSSFRYIDNPQAASIFGGYMSLATGSLALGPKSGSFVGGRYAIEARPARSSSKGSSATCPPRGT